MKRKVLIIILLFLVIIMAISVNVNAVTLNQFKVNIAENDLYRIDLRTLTQRIIQIISYIGSALSVIVILVIGIKYITGSIEEKAEYKKTLTPYVVGCIIIFSGSMIVQTIYGVISGIDNQIIT